LSLPADLEGKTGPNRKNTETQTKQKEERGKRLSRKRERDSQEKRLVWGVHAKLCQGSLGGTNKKRKNQGGKKKGGKKLKKK